VVGCTVSREPEAHAFASPFVALPYPHLDPRHSHSSTGVGSGSSGNGSGRGGSGSGSGSGAAPPKAKGPGMVQVTRYHFRLDDAKVNPLVSPNSVLGRPCSSAGRVDARSLLIVFGRLGTVIHVLGGMPVLTLPVPRSPPTRPSCGNTTSSPAIPPTRKPCNWRARTSRTRVLTRSVWRRVLYRSAVL
jgi:hypothetical protein